MSEAETPDVEVQEEAPQEKDLSHIPEHAREYVEPEKYESDPDYKRAVDHKWKPYDKYVADGGDPALWTGYKKFNKSYDDEVYRRELREQLKETQRSQKAILETFEEQKRQAVERALAEREAQLKVAIEDGNAAEAVRLQREIMENKAALPAAAPVDEPVIVKSFRRKVDVLNPGSENYNPEVNAEFEQICTNMAKKYYETYGRQLSDLEVKGILDEAYEMVKDKIPQKKPSTPAKAPASAKPANTPERGAPKLTADQKRAYEKFLSMKGGEQIAANYLERLKAR